jgi:hemoglobin-like flavoprotein
MDQRNADSLAGGEPQGGISPARIALVQSSFKSVVPMADEAATLFYSRLFEIAPETRPLFAEDISRQKKKLIQMLAWAVTNLHQIDRILPAIQDLGRRHAGYEVKPSFYQPVGAALIWTLEQGLGRDAFTDEIREAWLAAYTVLSGAMIEASRQTPQADQLASSVIDGAGASLYGALDWFDSENGPADDLTKGIVQEPPRTRRPFWWRDG